MAMYNSFNEMAAGTGALSPALLSQMNVFNTPVVNNFSELECIDGSKGGIDKGSSNKGSVMQAFQVDNESPPFEVVNKVWFGIHPSCLNDNRMHVHVRATNGTEAEFWLEENGSPQVSLKDVEKGFPKGKINELMQYVDKNKGKYVREWVEQAKQFIGAQKHIPKWVKIAEDAGYIEKAQT